MFEYILMFLALCAVGQLGGRETMSAPSPQLNDRRNWYVISSVADEL